METYKVYKVWFAEAKWIDTSHSKECETCHGEMEEHRMGFGYSLFPYCVCPASTAETTDTKCVCVVREATDLERRAFGDGMSEVMSKNR